MPIFLKRFFVNVCLLLLTPFLLTNAHAGKTFTLSPACQDKSIEYDKKCKGVVPSDPGFDHCMSMVKDVGTACSIPAKTDSPLFKITPQCKKVTQKYCTEYRQNPTEESFNKCFKDHQKEMSVCNQGYSEQKTVHKMKE